MRRSSEGRCIACVGVAARLQPCRHDKSTLRRLAGLCLLLPLRLPGGLLRQAGHVPLGSLEPLFARVSASIVTHVRFPVLHLASPIMLTSYRSAAAAPSEQNRIE